MGKSTINGPFSIAMLNYQRVCTQNNEALLKINNELVFEVSNVACRTQHIPTLTPGNSSQAVGSDLSGVP